MDYSLQKSNQNYKKDGREGAFQIEMHPQDLQRQNFKFLMFSFHSAGRRHFFQKPRIACNSAWS